MNIIETKKMGFCCDENGGCGAELPVTKDELFALTTPPKCPQCGKDMCTPATLKKAKEIAGRDFLSQIFVAIAAYLHSKKDESGNPVIKVKVSGNGKVEFSHPETRD